MKLICFKFQGICNKHHCTSCPGNGNGGVAIWVLGRGGLHIDYRRGVGVHTECINKGVGIPTVLWVHHSGWL